MQRAAFVVLLLSSSACGVCGADPHEGVWWAEWAEDQGTCGDIEDDIWRGFGANWDLCQETKSETTETCDTEVNARCGDDVVGVVVTSEDAGGVLHGTYALERRDSTDTLICTSTYFVTFTRLE